MRVLIGILLLLLSNTCLAQVKRVNFSEIDWNVQFVDAPTIDSLSRKLTEPYSTDLQKVRSIFRWITEHISYKVRGPLYLRRPATVSYEVPEDQDSLLKPLTERVALNVFRKREAVCDGYARLFKTLCDYAGIQSEVINGYARGDVNRVGQSFVSNHAWNAVFIDSSWYLLDATWASGYITYRGDAFVKRYDDSYFMASPQTFIMDHYPDELRWSLLPNPPTVREFHHTPFKSQYFVRNKIKTFKPSRGIIEGAIGSKVEIVLDMADIDYNEETPDPLDADTTLVAMGKLVNLMPEIRGKKLYYTFPIESDTVEWLNICYRNEVVMRYRLDILRPESYKQVVR